MKRNLIAAAILSLASIAAMASPASNTQSGSASGYLGAQGEYTVGTVSGSVSANSNISGDAVSATRVNGNGYSSQQTTAIGTGSATGSINVTPNSVTANTSQTATSNVVSQGVSSGNTPALDGNGLIVNGTAGLSSVQNTAGAGVSQTFTGATGQFGVSGYGGYTETGAVGGWN